MRENIHQLQGLAVRMDSDEVLPFSTKELGPGFPRRVMDLIRLVNEALWWPVTSEANPRALPPGGCD